jgi:acetylornithine deacetylase/succinyl-diaminopimelate desuccinylase-like protein
MPTLVFGAGDLNRAHSVDERVQMDDIQSAAQVLVMFLTDWCGVEGKEEENAC